MTLSEELTWRGFVNQTTYKELNQLDGDPITFYWGVDPSANSMTIGNLAAAMMVKCFMKHGHKPVLLVGGATGMIGDPDGKKQERSLITPQEIAANKAVIAEQYSTVFDGQAFTLVDNYDWFKGQGYLEFLRTVGKHVPMRQMLSRDFVQSRLGEQGAGISYAEFSYVLIQAYDFLHLHKTYDVSLQVCGSDQWGNSIAGVDLIRRVTGDEAHVYSVPLVINKATGVKFGKSEAGAIWLDAAKTPISNFYQFWLNLDDDGLEYYLKIYTELDQAAIEAVISEHQQNRRVRLGQTRLAEEVTRLIHGQAAVDFAKKIGTYLTGQLPVGEANDDELAAIKDQLQYASVDSTSASIVDALEASGLAVSKSEARRLLQGKAIYCNGAQVAVERFEATDFTNGRLLLRRGKAYKDSALIEVRH